MLVCQNLTQPSSFTRAWDRLCWDDSGERESSSQHRRSFRLYLVLGQKLNGLLVQIHPKIPPTSSSSHQGFLDASTQLLPPNPSTLVAKNSMGEVISAPPVDGAAAPPCCMGSSATDIITDGIDYPLFDIRSSCMWLLTSCFSDSANACWLGQRCGVFVFIVSYWALM